MTGKSVEQLKRILMPEYYQSNWGWANARNPRITLIEWTMQ
jgi:hypothetical protein